MNLLKRHEVCYINRAYGEPKKGYLQTTYLGIPIRSEVTVDSVVVYEKLEENRTFVLAQPDRKEKGGQGDLYDIHCYDL